MFSTSTKTRVTKNPTFARQMYEHFCFEIQGCLSPSALVGKFIQSGLILVLIAVLLFLIGQNPSLEKSISSTWFKKGSALTEFNFSSMFVQILCLVEFFYIIQTIWSTYHDIKKIEVSRLLYIRFNKRVILHIRLITQMIRFVIDNVLIFACLVILMYILKLKLPQNLNFHNFSFSTGAALSTFIILILSTFVYMFIIYCSILLISGLYVSTSLLGYKAMQSIGVIFVTLLCFALLTSAVFLIIAPFYSKYANWMNNSNNFKLYYFTPILNLSTGPLLLVQKTSAYVYVLIPILYISSFYAATHYFAADFFKRYSLGT